MPRVRLMIGIVAVVAALLPTLPAAAAGERFVIDFEGMAEGSLVSSVVPGAGTSGDPFVGAIAVDAWQAGDRSTRRAMIFDGTCAPRRTRAGCSGQDSDLFFPNRGNILIVSEDLDPTDPDDATGSWFSFDFSTVGPVTIESVGILDTNNQTTVLHLTLGNGTVVTRQVPGTGDGRGVDAKVGVGGVVALEIDLGGLGAIDDIVVSVDPAPPTTTTTTTTTTSTTTTVPATTTTTVAGSTTTTVATTTTVPGTTTTTTVGGSTTTTSTVPVTTTTSTTVPTPTTTTTLPVDSGLSLQVMIDGIPVAGVGPDRQSGTTGVVSYTVTNLHPTRAYALYLKQTGFGTVTCPDRTLDPGEIVVCERVITFEDGAVAEVATAKAWPETTELVATAPVAYRGVSDASSGFSNIAPGGIATQSSTAAWGSGTPAHLAIDGNLDGHRDGGSVAMTYRVADPWWEIDLGDVFDLDHVTLWNRTDCCSERLERFHVFVSDVPFEVRDVANTITQDGVLDVYHHGVAGRRVDLPIGRTGRYVRVQLAYQDAVLQLAEVEVMVTDSTPSPSPVVPSLDLSVSTPMPVVTVGDDISFTYDVTNTGPARLWAVYVRHADLGRADCPSGRLMPGDTVTCSLVATRPAGSWDDTVIVKAWDDDGLEVVATSNIQYVVSNPGGAGGPALGMQVLLGGVAVSAPGPLVPFGSDLEWTYTVINAGSVDLFALYLKHGARIVDCPQRDLVPGQSVECSATFAAEAGDHADEVVVSAWDAPGDQVSATRTAWYRSDVAPDARSFSLRATVAGDDAETAPGPVVVAGSPLPLEFAATNTGAVNLYGLWISAPGFGLATCPDRDLAPGETVVCSISTPAAPGQYATTARAVVYDGSGAQVEAFDRAHLFVPSSTGPAVHLDVLVDGLNGDQPAGPRFATGQTLTFSYLVTGTGSTPLDAVSLADTEFGAIGCPANSIIPGAMLVCTRQKSAVPGATFFDSTVNGATGPQVVWDTERLYYHVRERGREEALALTVTINGHDANTAPGPALEVGRTAQIRYVLTNTSTQTTIYSASILDPRVPAGQISCNGGPQLERGRSMICTATVTVQPGSWANIVTGHGYGQNGVRIDTSDRLHYTGVL